MIRTLLLVLLAALVSCREELPPPTVDTPTAMETEAIVSEPAPDSLLRHAVFFAFKEEATAADIDRVQQAFSALPD